MEKIKRLFPLFFLFIIIAVVYRVWFGNGILSSVDLGMTFHSMYFNDYLYPFAWYWNQGVGLGGNAVSLLWIYFDFALTKTIFGQILGLPWSITERLAYFFPFLILGLASSTMLAKSIFPKNPFLVFSALIFLVNPYILMVIGGGQLWIFLSYAISPVVLYLFINEIDLITELEKWNSRKPFFIGLIFSFQFLVDLRIAYVTLFAAFLYWLFKILQKRKIKNLLISLGLVFLIPVILTLIIHAFWIIPTLIIGQNPLNQFGLAYTSTDAVKYFSFAKLEDSISLLQPNWPENIFGKVYFMRFEFLLLPILAFSSLLFLGYKSRDQSEQNTELRGKILFFALLGLIGAFLAKGANPPFGEIYLWMFSYVPGFVMFRDPTKWYTLVALSYSVLIPFSIWKIFEWIKSQPKFQISNFQFQIKSKNQIFNFQNVFLMCNILYLLFLIRPAIFGQLGGTFKITQIPNEYFKLESFLSSQNRFFRTFWLPSVHRFGLNSKDHPAITGQIFLGTYDIYSMINKFKAKEDSLRHAAVKYVIVPYDPEGEIFLEERKYSEKKYKKAIEVLEKIPWLKKQDGFGKIAVFEVSNPKDHWYLISKNNSVLQNPESKIIYKYINPTKYSIQVQNVQKGDRLVFSESFDGFWFAKIDGSLISSKRYDKLFNSFILPKSGNYSFEVYYKPQDWVNIGLVISLTSLGSIIGFLLITTIKTRNL